MTSEEKISTLVAFTGNRTKMNIAQRRAFRKLLERWQPTGLTFRHGCCSGADRMAHLEVIRRWAPDYAMGMQLFPSNAEQYEWGFNELKDSPEAEGMTMLLFPIEAPLLRNRRMVRGANHLVAAPRGFYEVMRSGTWATIRYAREMGVPRTIILPDGRLTEERE